VFHSVPDLIAKIEEYLNAHNAKDTTVVWTAIFIAAIPWALALPVL
jgi:hypothetical protein